MKKKDKQYIYTVGGNLADGTRFEAGDEVGDIPAADLKALIEMDAVKEAE